MPPDAIPEMLPPGGPRRQSCRARLVVPAHARLRRMRSLFPPNGTHRRSWSIPQEIATMPRRMHLDLSREETLKVPIPAWRAAWLRRSKSSHVCSCKHAHRRNRYASALPYLVHQRIRVPATRAGRSPWRLSSEKRSAYAYDARRTGLCLQLPFSTDGERARIAVPLQVVDTVERPNLVLGGEHFFVPPMQVPCSRRVVRPLHCDIRNAGVRIAELSVVAVETVGEAATEPSSRRCKKMVRQIAVCGLRGYRCDDGSDAFVR